MEAVDRFRIEPEGGESLRSRLIDSEGHSVEVEGTVLEGQFRCSKGYLVIASDGIPFEEALHFYLVGSGGDLLDGISLGQAYHAGILRDAAAGQDTLDFSFFGDERWRLSIRKSRDSVMLPNPWATVRSLSGWLRGHYLRLERLG